MITKTQKMQIWVFSILALLSLLNNACSTLQQTELTDCKKMCTGGSVTEFRDESLICKCTGKELGE